MNVTPGPRHETAINGFQVPNRFLSNFHLTPLTFQLDLHGLTVRAPTAEHAYQASKAASRQDA